jgi:hypothetical protein
MKGTRAVAALLNALVFAQEPVDTNCTFRAEPDRFLAAEVRAQRHVQDRLTLFSQDGLARFSRDGPSRIADARDIPQRNFIDQAIFGKLIQNNVRSASLTGDYEFVRRIHLDLTGRIPSKEAIESFVADTNPNKRDQLIDSLLYSPEFSRRWTLWLGDLMQNAAFNSFQSIQINGRNQFHAWMLKSLDDPNRSLKDMVWEALVAKGNNYDESAAPVNWNIRSRTPGGPAQDSYDTAFNRAATQFLGIGHYDCILCHNGRGHLESLSLWGKDAPRTEAQGMAAFFARMRFTYTTNDQTNYYFNSWSIADAATGNYDLNTTFGNRPNRTAIGATRAIPPQYRLGQTPRTSDWRAELATFMVEDPMFARNIANRIWKQLFNMALAEPVDQLDPARMDPKNPPPAPWSLQASHPELLERLAEHLASVNFNLREFVRVLVSSSAYQLSSRYDETWKIDYVPMFARHYPRRLEGEEIHDAIQMGTQVLANYTVQGWTETAKWAVHLPEPVEPRSNGGALNFMNSFYRGNRDTTDRQQLGSILQQLNIMNDNVVRSRIKVAASPTLRRVAGMADYGAAVDELFLMFLSRPATSAERASAIRFYETRGAANRNASTEDLAWALINRSEFILSY